MKEKVLVFLLSLSIPFTVYISDWAMAMINYSVCLFILLISCFLSAYIPNPYISFALISVLCIGGSVYDVEYIRHFFPISVFVWMIAVILNGLIKNYTVPFIIAQFCYIISASFCFSFSVTFYCNPAAFFGRFNYYLLIPIVLIIFALMQRGKICGLRVSTYDEQIKNEQKQKVGYDIIIFASYIWMLFFIVDIGLKYTDIITPFLPIMCGTIYLVVKKEPLITKAFKKSA